MKLQKKFLNQSAKHFVSDYVHLLYYKCHKVNLNCDGSYLDCPDLIRQGKATINPINKKVKYFPQAVKVALNPEEKKRIHKN